MSKIELEVLDDDIKGDKKKKEDWFQLLPIIFILAFVPLIVYLKMVTLKGIAYDSWKGDNNSLDFFSYYKMVFFLIGAAFSVIVFIINAYTKKKIVKTYFYIPIGIYGIAIIISTILSQHKDIAISGYIERYEGALVLIGYLLTTVITMNLVKSEDHIVKIIKAIFFSTTVICIIGIFQYFGHDIFRTNIGKNFILPAKFLKYKDSLTFLDGRHILYSTLYHNDYVGSYIAMLFPLVFTIFIFIKDRKNKTITGVLTLITLVVWITCNSRAGLVGGAFSLFILVLLCSKKIFKKWSNFGITLMIFVIIVFGMNVISKGKISDQVTRLTTDVIALFSNENIDLERFKDLPLKDIKVNGSKAAIVTSKNTLNIEVKEGNIFFKDNEEKDIMASNDITGNISLQNEDYKDYKFQLVKNGSMLILQCSKDNFILNFGLVNDELKLLDGMLRTLELKPFKKLGFEGKESIGSARGFIWSRTLPLILDKPLFGYGPDTFTIYFPQQDIIGKYNNYDGRMWEIVDKPHNMYLQIAFSTGIPSLLAFLSLMIMYFIASIKVYFNNKFEDFTSIVGVGIFVGLMGYLVTGFFNDSVISVAPVFWILLGLGININIKLKRNLKFEIRTSKPIENNNSKIENF